ncbi:MAG TPA: HAMP domain-containing sensor histidine kinase [Anaerolineales bacterium]|nr:HAMP domain-containing sensor histidine kinase [Anaerolineales bacterium]
MSVVDSLSQIRSVWISRVSHQLARGAVLRESFLAQLNRFYDAIIQAVESGDPSWMDPILNEWVEARTQTELSLNEASLYPILSEILQITQEVLKETNQADGLEIWGAMLPIFSRAYEQSARREIEMRVVHVQRELQLAQFSLERLDRSKSDFISIAAHELKTPLTLIEGYAAMIRDLLPKEQDAMGQVLVKGIDNGTKRLREIIDDMIDVSLIDNNLLTLTFQPLWLNRLLGTLREELKEIVSQRKQTLLIHSFEGSDEMTFGDSERIYQALRNLMTNAIKYTPDGGQVTVDGRKLPGFIEIIIQDTGIGIDPDDHAIIFEKFGRLGNVSLHSSGKTKFKGGGPGLGLPITKGLIEAHGGTIWVESDGYDEVKCPGTTFHVLLPMRKEPPDDKIAKLFSPLTDGKQR